MTMAMTGGELRLYKRDFRCNAMGVPRTLPSTCKGISVDAAIESVEDIFQ